MRKLIGGLVLMLDGPATAQTFTVLHSFDGADGSWPWTLILSGNTLYGNTTYGGSSSNSVGGDGTVFKVNTDGTGLTNLHTFTAPSYSGSALTNYDGMNPGVLILSSNTLYGVAETGGSSGNGTVFRLTLPLPQLAIIHSQANVILTWPTNDTGFTLRSTTNLLQAVWSTNSPVPVVVNTNNAVTNTVSGTQQFFRLSQ
jgi:uncharacterized repeat protein (TIGR03803 family)